MLALVALASLSAIIGSVAFILLRLEENRADTLLSLRLEASARAFRGVSVAFAKVGDSAREASRAFARLSRAFAKIGQPYA